LRLDCDDDLYAVAACDLFAITQRHTVIDVAFKQSRSPRQLEVFAADEDFIARSFNRLLETKKARLRREIERAGSTDAANAYVVRAVAYQFARNCELARRGESICGGEPFRDKR